MKAEASRSPFSSLLLQSMENRARHADALVWTGKLTSPSALIWLEQKLATDSEVTHLAVRELLAPLGYREDPGEDLMLCRDPLGKPCIFWQGDLADWALSHRIDWQSCHISNTHDGGAHLVLAACDERLTGLGIDAVYLPRLRAPEKEKKNGSQFTPSGSPIASAFVKDAAYLRRFAAHYMGAREWEAFETASAEEEEEPLRLRVAAHFSLMEAASKALGLGLKIGVGMGHALSLPKQSVGALALSPHVELLLEGPALQRMAELSANRAEAYWAADEEFLVSIVLLWRE